MSASERLKKLEEMRTATEPMTYNKPLTAGILTAKVLPEIIALVETTADYRRFVPPRINNEYEVGAAEELDHALAALDEALDFVRLY